MKKLLYGVLALAIALIAYGTVPPQARADRNYVEPCFYHDTAGADAKASPLCHGLAELWNFEEGSDSDRFGVFKTPLLEPSGVNVPSAAGRLGNGIDLESSGAQDTFTGFVNLGGAPYTIAAWVKLEDLPVNVGDRMTIVSWDTDNVPGPHLYVERFSTGPSYRACLANKETETTSSVALCFSAMGLISGNWHLIVAGESPYFVGKSRLFVSLDGGTITTSATAYYTSPGIHILDVGTRRTKISGATFQNRFDGVIDQLAFWKRAFSQTDVNLLYNSGSGRAYPFDTET